MSEKLKPCPFCGSESQSMLSPDCKPSDPPNVGTRAFPIIRCQRCHTDVPGRNWDNSGKSAEDAWNRRVEASQARIAELEASNKRLCEALKSIAMKSEALYADGDTHNRGFWLACSQDARAALLAAGEPT
jgi:NMD protein affecting ribosome stability and mRNA decay